MALGDRSERRSGDGGHALFGEASLSHASRGTVPKAASGAEFHDQMHVLLIFVGLVEIHACQGLSQMVHDVDFTLHFLQIPRHFERGQSFRTFGDGFDGIRVPTCTFQRATHHAVRACTYGFFQSIASFQSSGQSQRRPSFHRMCVRCVSSAVHEGTYSDTSQTSQTTRTRPTRPPSLWKEDQNRFDESTMEMETPRPKGGGNTIHDESCGSGRANAKRMGRDAAEGRRFCGSGARWEDL
mmetsp:Transcript_1796/g.6766  ORF Transcript_1796/g.6766 Transcript_1796/m.6766 type:complete len:240 (-) Transcript_1796:262-981(-)